MPAPIKVELVPYSADWQELAQMESLRLSQALKDNLIVVHHIGSTAIPRIHAKPIVDLMPVLRSVRELDQQESVFLQLGYRHWGEYGIPGRRYYTFDEPSTGRRRFQLHCFGLGNGQIKRHLAFRDYLRANLARAMEYDEEKRRCRELHPDNSHAYSAAKAAWITAELPAALAHFTRDAE